MPKILDNFIKEIKNLDKYLILQQEKEDFLILGTKISIKVQKEILGNVFQPHTRLLNKEFYVYFRIAFADKESKLKEFDYLPTLYVANYLLNPIKPPKPVKESKAIKKYTSEKFISTPNHKSEDTYNEFDLLHDLEQFINKTYYS